MKIPEIIKFFKNEFKTLENKFKILSIPTNQKIKCNDYELFENGKWIKYENDYKPIVMPGVYVIWSKNDGVIKVGRHMVNSRMRAYQHFNANYSVYPNIKNLEEESESKILLINVIDEKDRHWVAALEIYLEKQLNPKVKSNRL